MAASSDESDELFHLVKLKHTLTFNQYHSLYNPNGSKNLTVTSSYKIMLITIFKAPHNTAKQAYNNSIPTSADFVAEKFDPVDQNAFDSQPVCNQEFFSKLDNNLQNLPREIYIDRIIEQTNNCDETISYYRNILVNKARLSEKCPNGLQYKTNTKQESSSKRYANDCYALQSFIDNDDPRVLTENIAKRRTTVKPN